MDTSLFELSQEKRTLGLCVEGFFTAVWWDQISGTLFEAKALARQRYAQARLPYVISTIFTWAGSLS